MLYDTYGFPLEITKEIAAERGFDVDVQGFQRALEEARERSRTSGKEFFQKGTDWSKYLEGIPTTTFTGYDSLELENMKLLKDIQTEDGQRVLIFDKTPFYPEM